ncbi:MAG: SDR family NAD(P)-dependent oxidoreductase [Novosphingobium sp.]|nr:SDR family NAD(P)-dependent oxidoreductase [Novosphingobium sp.]
MSLSGKVAVVTGAGSGIGRGIAQRLARDGAAVGVWDLNLDGADDTVRLIGEAGGKALAIKADCSNAAEIKAAADRTRAAFGAINILVNNAGIAPFVKYLEIDDAQWDRIMAVNLKGPHLCIREMLPAMLEAGWGRVINITSSSTQSGSPMQGHYVASKGGLLGLTKALALEFAPSGVTFNMVPPGFIDTPMLRASPIDIDGFAQSTPMKRPGTVEEMGAACAYLASDDAGYVTGQTISVNGGRYMGSA